MGHAYAPDALGLTMINWRTVTNNLRAKYKPLSQVANEVGSNEQHLNRLARGEVNQPRYNTGVKLLDLHYDHCPERHNMIDIGEG